MRRRQYLLAGAAGIGICTAGCTSVAPGVKHHPFANSTVDVRVENNSDTPHDVEQLAQTALDYWEEYSEEFVGFGIEFESVETDPDMEILFADDPSGCEGVEGFSERVLGCAPVLRAGSTLRRPATARVVAAARPPGKITITTKHEIGHILGLGHDDDPRHIMSNQPQDRIPLYEVRITIWEGVLTAHGQSNDAGRLYSHALEMWQAGNYEATREAAAAASREYDRTRETLEALLPRVDELADQPRVETVALDDLWSLVDRLIDRANAAGDVSRGLAAAAIAQLEGDADTVQSNVRAANEAIERFTAIGHIELRDVAIALGLVRGFDRDDAVIQREDEELEPDGETA